MKGGSRDPHTGPKPAAVAHLLYCLNGQEIDEPAVDWPSVVALARQHKLDPLLYHRLEQRVDRYRIPGPEYEQLRKAYYLSADRSIRLYHQLQPVLVALRNHDIPVIALKGGALAELVYRNIALRPMADVDLLVPKADLAKARAVLIEAGCTHKPDIDIDSWCRISHQLSIFGIPVPSSAATRLEEVTVELHWTIENPTSPFAIAIAGLWDRAQPAQVAGVEVLTLCPEDLLLHVCLHTAHHHGFGTGLLPFFDIAFIIERHGPDFDWPRFVQRARAWGVARYIGLALMLARILRTADVPDNVPDELTGGKVDRDMLDAAGKCVLSRIPYLQAKPKSMREIFGAGSFKDRLKILRYRISSPNVLGGVRRRILRPFMSKLLSRRDDRKRALADWLAGR